MAVAEVIDAHSHWQSLRKSWCAMLSAGIWQRILTNGTTRRCVNDSIYGASVLGLLSVPTCNIYCVALPVAELYR